MVPCAILRRPAIVKHLIKLMLRHALFPVLAIAALTWPSKAEGSNRYLQPYDQLPRYKAATQGQIFNLTNANGVPVDESETETLNDEIIDNHYLMLSLTHFARESSPHRSVHSKGAGAFGYFEVTHDISDICKAKVFSGVGKRTRVAVRFSNQAGGVDGSDITRDPKGFAVKFYTEEGNLDLLALNFPVFPIKDPLYFPSLMHALTPNPQTALIDNNMAWDFHTLRPESILHVMHIFGDPGLPNCYRHMPGYPIHSFQVYNNQGNISYVRFRFEPDAGIENLPSSEGIRLTGEDHSYFNRDLYESILNGDFPSWTISIQHMSPEDVEKADFNPFDVTLMWPEKQYPPKPIGKLVLNENLKNHYSENLLISYNPGNLVHGICGAGDKIFQARHLTYLEGANYRLGNNLYKVKVNCPITGTNNYFRNGAPPVGDNGENTPNYYPNSFNGPVPSRDPSKPKLIKHYVDPEPKNYDQARDMYENLMSEAAKTRLIENIAKDLSSVVDFIRERAIEMFTKVHPEFGQRVANGIKKAMKSDTGIKKPVPIKD